MIKRILFFSSLPLLCFVVVFSFTGEKKDLHYETFQTTNGWGYNVLRNRDILIHQEANSGETSLQYFQTKGEAEKTAQLMIEKIKQGCLAPIEKEKIEGIEKDEMEKIEKETVNK